MSSKFRFAVLIANFSIALPLGCRTAETEVHDPEEPMVSLGRAVSDVDGADLGTVLLVSTCSE